MNGWIGGSRAVQVRRRRVRSEVFGMNIATLLIGDVTVFRGGEEACVMGSDVDPGARRVGRFAA